MQMAHNGVLQGFYLYSSTGKLLLSSIPEPTGNRGLYRVITGSLQAGMYIASIETVDGKIESQILIVK
jgi:hypothetical protein